MNGTRSVSAAQGWKRARCRHLTLEWRGVGELNQPGWGTSVRQEEISLNGPWARRFSRPPHLPHVCCPVETPSAPFGLSVRRTGWRMSGWACPRSVVVPPALLLGRALSATARWMTCNRMPSTTSWQKPYEKREHCYVAGRQHPHPHSHPGEAAGRVFRHRRTAHQQANACQPVCSQPTQTVSKVTQSHISIISSTMFVQSLEYYTQTNHIVISQLQVAKSNHKEKKLHKPHKPHACM